MPSVTGFLAICFQESDTESEQSLISKHRLALALSPLLNFVAHLRSRKLLWYIPVGRILIKRPFCRHLLSMAFEHPSMAHFFQPRDRRFWRLRCLFHG